MEDREKPLADKWIEKAKDNPVVAALVLIGFLFLLIKPLAGPFDFLIAKFWPRECKPYKNFSVDLLYSDESAKKRTVISDELDSVGYNGRRINTGFEELQRPGEPGTAWVVYPSCLGNDDQRLLKVLSIMNANGYSATNHTLDLKPHSSSDFESVQISLF